jgi:DNA-directed RNA polymerase specialized sigma24 family protein
VTANPNSEASRAVFATTHWSVVLGAGQKESPKASEAMAHLCRTYWYPLYAYVRRKGYNVHDAQDLTQEFFARLLARNYLSVADRNKGKFRSFLLGSLEHFLAREWTKAHARKRGGGQIAFSFDAVEAENRYLLEPATELTPERIYDRRWSTTLLERAMTRLEAECLANHKGDLFARAKGFLSGERGEGSYSELATTLSISEGAARVAIHRLRQRYGELVRDEIGQTVANSGEVDEELRYLVTLLRDE